MQITKTRSLIVIAGLALGAGGMFGFVDDHAKPESTPAHTPTQKDDHASAKDDTQSEAKPRSRYTSRSKRTKASEPAKEEPKSEDNHATKASAAEQASEDAHGSKASKPASAGEHPAEDEHAQHADAPQHDAHAATAKSAHAGEQVSTLATSSTPATADEALAILSEGNARWVSGKVENPSIDAERREDLAANGQHPFVTIVTCADSRIPVERCFDRGVGELFVVRVAGNTAGGNEVGTVEYGTGHLKTKLLVVLGHTKCGAVAAAASNAQLHGKVAELVDSIKPAVDRAKRNNPSASGDELAALAVRENVWETIYDMLSSSSDIRNLVSTEQLKVVGAVYDIASGKVEWMGEHPWQRELVTAMNGASSTPAVAEAHSAAHGDGHGDGHGDAHAKPAQQAHADEDEHH